MSIGILGGGVWGSALARLLSNNKVTIFARDSKVVDSINNHHFNPKLKYVVFNENVTAQTNLDSLSDKQYIFIALPAQKIREVLLLGNLKSKEQEIIIASKGIELQSGLLLDEIVKQTSSTKKISILSGPCFSDEVAQNLPTAVTFASKSKKSFNNISALIKNKNFRIYYSDDLIGCQIGGALKNIYAIASGITMGLNLGENAKSAIITRSFVEINRLAESLGADKKTIFGLSGLGDLILTCNSVKSRNTKFGHIIATTKAPNFKEILKSQQITEGFFTVAGVYKMAKEKKIDLPIMKSIYNILYNEYSITDEINNLLERPITDEF
jgi:glycerol-3-phosphate dehydrogenase (NAD(P)+)